jgi:hypothetical protein
VQLETLVQRAQQETQAIQVRQDLKATQVILVLLDHKVTRDQQVPLEILEQQATLVLQEILATQDLQVLQVIRVLQAQLATRERQDLLGQQVMMVS